MRSDKHLFDLLLSVSFSLQVKGLEEHTGFNVSKDYQIPTDVANRHLSRKKRKVMTKWVGCSVISLPLEHINTILPYDEHYIK